MGWFWSDIVHRHFLCDSWIFMEFERNIFTLCVQKRFLWKCRLYILVWKPIGLWFLFHTFYGTNRLFKFILENIQYFIRYILSFTSLYKYIFPFYTQTTVVPIVLLGRTVVLNKILLSRKYTPSLCSTSNM